MKDNFSYSLLLSGVMAAHNVSSHNLYFSWINVGLQLFQSFNGIITSMSLYTLNHETENLEEEVVIDNDGAVRGVDYVPVYQLPEGILTKLQTVTIEMNALFRILMPLSYDEQFIGLIELRTKNPLTENTYATIRDMASALSLGMYLKSYTLKASKDKYLFDAVIHINSAIQSCSDIDELLLVFSKLTLQFLKFDRISVFICDQTGNQIIHNICVTAKGEIHTVENVADLPIGITTPSPLEDLSGFWIPIRYRNQTFGIVLADNIYTLCEISQDSITVLSALCTQLALSIEHLRLLKNITIHAQFDDLTGVLNRRMIVEEIERCIIASKRDLSLFTLCYLDMNHMKTVNDKFGHAMGDDMLKNFTRIIKEHLRKNDIIGRVGGDEFVLIFPDCDTTIAEKIWNRVLDGFELFNKTNLIPYQLSASYGMFQFYPEHDFLPDQIISFADNMMYKEKLRNNISQA